MTGITSRAFDDVNEVNGDLNETLNELKRHFAEKIVAREQTIIDHYNTEIEQLNKNFNIEFKKQLKRQVDKR